MNPSELLNILKNIPKISKFLEKNDNIEIILKRLTPKDIERLSLEYPNLLESSIQLISCLTLVKNEVNEQGYKNVKKIKVYIDEINEIPVKILEN
jgi:hypothetical protein